MTLATISRPWVWLLLFYASGLKTAGSCLGVALGIGLDGRLGVGFCGGAAAGEATSWVMVGGGPRGVFIGDATTTSVGVLLLRTGRLPPLEVVLPPPLEFAIPPPLEVVILRLFDGEVPAALEGVMGFVAVVVPAVGWR